MVSTIHCCQAILITYGCHAAAIQITTSSTAYRHITVADITNTTSFVFAVRAGGHALMMLSDDLGSEPYEIHINYMITDDETVAAMRHVHCVSHMGPLCINLRCSSGGF
jgi:hypothetical protein